MSKSRELIISPKVSQTQLAKFLPQLEDEGIKMVYLDPKKLGKKKTKLQTVFPSSAANYVVLEKDGPKPKGKKVGRKFQILSNSDIENVLNIAKKGLDFVVIEVKDWKIIPLENIIAKLHKIHTKIFAIARTPEEVRKMFSILEVGVDGVIFSTSSINEVREVMVYLGTKSFDMKPAKITEIKEVGDGERVCVDTASMLHKGEGMLIGSRSNFLFLVHNESVGSSFTSPRPFRVNAGAVHCYTLSPDGTTNYLSEVETGSEVLILNSKGKARYCRDPGAPYRKVLKGLGHKIPEPSYWHRRWFKLGAIKNWFCIHSSPETAINIFDELNKRKLLKDRTKDAHNDYQVADKDK